MPSKLKVIHIPATAGNVPTSVSPPPDGHKYRLIGFQLVLVNDATVANRYLRLHLYVAGTSDEAMPYIQPAAALTASQTGTYGGFPYHLTCAGSNMAPAITYTVGIDSHFLIDSEVTLGIEVYQGVAGDSYSGHFLVEDIAP